MPALICGSLAFNTIMNFDNLNAGRKNDAR